MADKRTRLTLQRLFAAGRIPLEEDFADLFASSLNQLDDGIRKEADQALKLKIPATVGPKEILLLYEDFDTNPLWKMQIRNTGLEISRGSATQPDLFIDSNGNLGIGTASPDAKLTLSDAFDADLNKPHTLLNLKVDGASDQNRTDIGVGFGSSIAFAAQRGGPNKAAVAGGFIDYYLYERPVGTVDRWAFRFRLRNDQWPNDDPQNPGSTVMTLLADGNVGIGTDAPDTRLHIDGKNTDTALKILSGDDGKQTRITLGRASVEAHLGLSAADDQFMTGSQTGDLCVRLDNNSKKMRFGFGPTTTNSTEMVIENGKVGIGTAALAQPLQNHSNFNDTSLLIGARSNNGGNSYSSPISMLSLTREGVINEAKANMADFRLGRYNDGQVNDHSKSQLDIYLADGNFTPRQVMSLRSNGDFFLNGVSPFQYKRYEIEIDQFNIDETQVLFEGKLETISKIDDKDNPFFHETGFLTSDWIVLISKVSILGSDSGDNPNGEVIIIQQNGLWKIKIENSNSKVSRGLGVMTHQRLVKRRIELLFIKKSIITLDPSSNNTSNLFG